jgi:NAD(P)-dependent dehydrogenase (short-subunit alcohol dehydrogenase family)
MSTVLGDRQQPGVGRARPRAAGWTVADIPPQAGRRAIITGTGGLGYETALALAQAGAEVILAGRNAVKGAAAIRQIGAAAPGARITFEPLDLASLQSVADFAARIADAQAALDLLVNNAGVMTPPSRKVTADGFELQFGTNYLGHFALTARLLPLLRRGRQPRVVNVSSGAHRLFAAIHLEDLQWQRLYRPWRAYAQSKLALLMFALELQRRSDANGWGLMSNAAHPGYARTDLIANGPLSEGRVGIGERTSIFLQPWISQSAAAGALPTLFAAASPAAERGGYYGPVGFHELKGPPGPAVIGKQAKDTAVARRLWQVSEELAGLSWPDSDGLRAG